MRKIVNQLMTEFKSVDWSNEKIVELCRTHDQSIGDFISTVSLLIEKTTLRWKFKKASVTLPNGVKKWYGKKEYFNSMIPHEKYHNLKLTAREVYVISEMLNETLINNYKKNPYFVSMMVGALRISCNEKYVKTYDMMLDHFIIELEFMDENVKHALFERTWASRDFEGNKAACKKVIERAWNNTSLQDAKDHLKKMDKKQIKYKRK